MARYAEGRSVGYNKPMRSLIAFATLICVTTGCLPAVLDKYRQKATSGSPGASIAGAVEDPLLPRTKDADDRSQYQTSGSSAGREPYVQRSTIYALNKQTFRFAMRENDVWETALNVLLRNYNLTIVDRSSGVITTEWDSFFLDKDVYRNRLSLRIFRSARDQVDVIVHNNVERLRDASQATNAVGAVWLPAEDRGSEVNRIIQNMALLLNQPPPVLPPSTAVAKGDDIVE